MSSHAYLPTSFSDSERRRLAKRLMGKRLALPGERPIGSHAVAFLCGLGLLAAVVLGVVCR